MRFNIHLFIYDLTLWNIFYRIPCRNHNIRHRYMVLFFFHRPLLWWIFFTCCYVRYQYRFWYLSFHPPACHYHNLLSIENFRRNSCNFLFILYEKSIFFRKNIHGKRMIDIGCRCYDRHCTDPFCKQSCKFICSAIMSGQNRDNKLSRLVHHQNRDVCQFITQRRCHGAHCDSACADPDDCCLFPISVLFETRAHPVVDAFFDINRIFAIGTIVFPDPLSLYLCI